MEELHFNADITGERIDKFLDGRIESLSRSYIQKLIKEKKILVNQLPVKANYMKIMMSLLLISQKEWLYILHRDITAIRWSMRFYITVEKTCRESMV